MIDLEAEARKLGPTYCYETPPTNSKQYLLFEKEKRLLGLQNENITLIMPELTDVGFPYERIKHVGLASGRKETGYTVRIFTCPRGAYYHPRLHYDRNYLKWEKHPMIFFSSIAAHELMHIKQGHCDAAIARGLFGKQRERFERQALAYETYRLDRMLAEGLITF